MSTSVGKPEMGMDFLHVVEGRRAVRRYRPDPIEKPLIEGLINTAVLAPSAMNLQPWRFAVISGVARLDDYARRAREHLLETTVVDPQLKALLDDPKFSMFYHAPQLVLVIATSEQAQAREDCCLAAQTLLLAARNRQLGTCWIGLARPWLNLPVTKAELGLPEACHIVAPIVLGHPEEWPESHGRRAPEIHWLD